LRRVVPARRLSAPAVGPPRIHAVGKSGVVAGQRWMVGNPIDTSRSPDRVGGRRPLCIGLNQAQLTAAAKPTRAYGCAAQTSRA
jgi:hypothetical protein